MEWTHLKEFVEYSTGFSRDSLHVILGVCCQLVLAAVFKVSVNRWWPWCVVLILASANEVNDLTIEYWDLPARQFGESVKDLVLTMFIPTVLVLLTKYQPQLFQKTFQQQTGPSEIARSDDEAHRTQ